MVPNCSAAVRRSLSALEITNRAANSPAANWTKAKRMPDNRTHPISGDNVSVLSEDTMTAGTKALRRMAVVALASNRSRSVTPIVATTPNSKTFCTPVD